MGRHGPARADTGQHGPTRTGQHGQHGPTRANTGRHGAARACGPTRLGTGRHGPTRANMRQHGPTQSNTARHGPTRGDKGQHRPAPASGPTWPNTVRSRHGPVGLHGPVGQHGHEPTWTNTPPEKHRHSPTRVSTLLVPLEKCVSRARETRFFSGAPEMNMTQHARKCFCARYSAPNIASRVRETLTFENMPFPTRVSSTRNACFKKQVLSRLRETLAFFTNYRFVYAKHNMLVARDTARAMRRWGGDCNGDLKNNVLPT